MEPTELKLRADIAGNLKNIQDAIKFEFGIWHTNEKSVAYANLVPIEIETLLTWHTITDQIRCPEGHLNTSAGLVINRYEKLKEVEHHINRAFRDRRSGIPEHLAPTRRANFQDMYTRLLADMLQLGMLLAHRAIESRETKE
jgi:hypothetical protein